MRQASLFGAPEFCDSDATITPDGLYRYDLYRRWAVGTLVNFVMLNPSTADAEQPDPTLTRCIGFAKSWGFGGLVLTNLFALRSTDPAALRSASDPVGPENDLYLWRWWKNSARVVCAWGNHGSHRNRDLFVLMQMRREYVSPLCFGLTAQKQPFHPLYQKSDAMLVPLEGLAR